MDPLAILGLAACCWFLLHASAGSDLRGWLVGGMGEKGYRALFSLASVLALGALIWAYRRAPCAPLWSVPRELLYLPIAVMPGALTLFSGAFLVRNPTALGAEAALSREEPARGVLRITRHPFLWGVAFWAAVHLAVNGNLASLFFFGTLLLTAVMGTRSIDRKRRRTHPHEFARYALVTSNVPFGAILSGRNRLVLRELAPALALGAVLTTIIVALHQTLFHVRPFP